MSAAPPPPAPAPPDALRARVLRGIAEEPAATRRGTIALRVGLAVAAFPVAGGLVLALGGVQPGTRELAWVGRLAAAWVGVAAVAAVALFLARGRGRVEPTSRALAIVTAATGLGVFGALLAMGPPPGAAAPAAPALAHASCLMMGAVLALVPALLFGAPLVARRLGDGRALGAALGALAGTLGATGVHLHCPRGGLAHALVAHAGVVLVLAALGAAAGRVFEVRVRTR